MIPTVEELRQRTADEQKETWLNTMRAYIGGQIQRNSARLRHGETLELGPGASSEWVLYHALIVKELRQKGYIASVSGTGLLTISLPRQVVAE